MIDEEEKKPEVEIIDTNGDSIKINDSGVHIKSKKVEERRNTNKRRVKSVLSFLEWFISGSIVILTVVAYVICGCCIPDTGWSHYWVIFFLIPVLPSIFAAIRLKKWSVVSVVFLSAGVYVTVGMFTNIWHPTWLILLFIPVYHAFAGWIDYRKKDTYYTNEGKDEQ